MRVRTMLFVAVLLCAITGGAGWSASPKYHYTVPDETKDGWHAASLAKEKMDAGLISTMVGRILSDGYKNIHSVLIVKDGKLVVEEYFPRTAGDRREQAAKRVSLHEVHSATKSINSILIGIALDQHMIHDVDQKISTFFPEYADIFADKQRDKLRLRDLLTMSSGLAWDEWTYPYTDPRNDHVAMLSGADPIRYVLSRPIVADPGTKFTYNSGIAIVLGQIIYKVSGLRADKFAECCLFKPLGISDYYWLKLPNDIVQTAGGLYLRPRDMAKIGCLFLDGGRWMGKQIVSDEWAKESVENRISAGQLPAAARADGYGYQWWLSSFRVGGRVVQSYSARGRGGQFILVLPAQKTVVVVTGWNDNDLMFQPLDMVQRYVLPAIGTLPAESATSP